MKLTKTAKELLLDPGVLCGITGSLLFASTNPVGLAACILATMVSVTSKALALTQPAFLEKFPTVKKIVSDPRTPMRANGFSMLTVATATLGGGLVSMAAGAAANLWHGLALPFVASSSFSLCNFRLAQSLSEANDPSKKEKQDQENLARKILKCPDTYLSTGFACAGLMAGGAGLWVLPIVGASYAMSLGNMLQKRPEHSRHPKALTSMAGALFSAIGFASGNILPGIAHVFNSLLLISVESRITPGGFPQILKDIRDGAVDLLKASPAKSKGITSPVPQRIPTPDAALQQRELSAFFSTARSPEKPRKTAEVPSHINEPATLG